jgi:hypothetical protein
MLHDHLLLTRDGSIEAFFGRWLSFARMASGAPTMQGGLNLAS